ncbi:MAG: thioesterase family protein [Caulobacteraceae bacterium]
MSDTLAGGVQIWRGGVNTWDCDEMGHMNVRVYVARALEGLASLALHLGQPCAFSASATATLIVREHRIRFHREARVGAALHMIGGVAAMGDSDAVLLQSLIHSETGEPCASIVTRVAHATPLDGRPFAWSPRSREAAERLAVEIPAHAAARSLIDQAEPLADPQRAEALPCIGQGVVTPQDCDVFGRMTADRFMGRISDGTGPLMAPLRRMLAEREGVARLGGVALEYRLTYGDLPRAGDHVELRSGLASLDAKVARLAHWLVDPVSGRPYAMAQGVVANFDLDARKIVAAPADLLAALQDQVRPGLLA